MRRLPVLLAIAAASMALAAPGHALAGPTVVSLTFDDGWDTQTTAASMLAAHGMLGTFYVNSGFIGTSAHLTWAQLAAINAAGNEVGGHTIDHPDLTTLTSTEAQHEICDDRTAIRSQGFLVNNFAYPAGAYDANTGAGPLDVSAIVQGCGYASGRGAFGLHNITATNDQRPYATSIPPPNLYEILTPCCINTASFGGSTPTAAALESYVQQAQSGGGGWVVFFFHRLCDNCGGDTPAPSMSPNEFSALLDWLAANGITVEPVGQVISGDSQPPTSLIACDDAPCGSSWYADSTTISLSGSDGVDGSGVSAIHFTTDGADPTVLSPTYTAPFALTSTATVEYRAWDAAGNVESVNSRTIQVDATSPSSSISCNGGACTGWYGSGISVSLQASDADSGVASIHYTTDGTDPTLVSPAYTAPFTLSATTTVKYRAWDQVGHAEATKSQTIQIDATPPSSSISCNAAPCNAWYGAAVTVSLSATDTGGSGVASIHYTTDGSTPTLASPTYTAPFGVTTTTTVKYRAWDVAGNASATATQTIQIDTTAPTVSIRCNGTTCAPWYGAGVSVALVGSDGGSGVASIHYTTDGSTPTLASPTYTGTPFSVTTTTTVKYRAWDVAGNASATATQTIQIDTSAPTVVITAPATGATVSGTVTVSATAGDIGSGVVSVSFYVDGTLLSTQSGPKFSVQWNTKKTAKGQHTLTAVATDRAGNKTTSTGVAVTVN